MLIQKKLLNFDEIKKTILSKNNFTIHKVPKQHIISSIFYLNNLCYLFFSNIKERKVLIINI